MKLRGNLRKKHGFTNVGETKLYIDEGKKESSSYLIKLCLNYSLNHLLKKKNLIEKNNTKKEDKDNQNEINENINNVNKLIKELERLLTKIKNFEIDISSIKNYKIYNNNIMKNINILFENLLYIYYKSILYRSFHKFKKKALKIKLTKNYENIDSFLEGHFNKIRDGMNLIKINYGSKGHKMHFYNIDVDSGTFNVKVLANQQYPTHSYNLFKDITKIMYGVKSTNLVKKLLAKKDKDHESIKLMQYPWRILSFITKKRSVDLYCDDDQVNNWFYGLKSFTDENNIVYKINSTNKFILYKIKFKIVIQLKLAISNGEIRDENNKYTNIIDRLIKEKGIHNISFTKLMILYNRLMNN